MTKFTCRCKQSNSLLCGKTSCGCMVVTSCQKHSKMKEGSVPRHTKWVETSCTTPWSLLPHRQMCHLRYFPLNHRS